MEICKSRLLLTFMFFQLMIISCKSTPETTQPPEEKKEQEQIQVTAEKSDVQTEEQGTEEQIIIEEVTVNPGKTIEEQHTIIQKEALLFIDTVNHLIKDRNYKGWEALLSQQYIEEHASADNLHRISETVIMRNSRIVLRSLEDFFTYVVVPSRISLNTDENIEFEFLNENSLQAFSFMITGTGEQRVMIYELEKVGDSWKIIR